MDSHTVVNIVTGSLSFAILVIYKDDVIGLFKKLLSKPEKTKEVSQSQSAQSGTERPSLGLKPYTPVKKDKIFEWTTRHPYIEILNRSIRRDGDCVYESVLRHLIESSDVKIYAYTESDTRIDELTHVLLLSNRYEFKWTAGDKSFKTRLILN